MSVRVFKNYGAFSIRIIDLFDFSTSALCISLYIFLAYCFYFPSASLVGIF